MSRWFVVAALTASACSGSTVKACGQGTPPKPVATVPPPSTSQHLPIGQLPDIDIAAVLAHTKVLSSDEFEGRAPGSPGEEKTVRYLDGSVQESRRQARQHRRHLRPEGAARRHHATSGAAADQERRAAAAAQVERRRGGLEQARRGTGLARQFRTGVRRLRRRRARIQLGRLQRHRRQGKDARRPRERSAGARPVQPEGARSENLRRESDDLLRPVDLQVRDGPAERCCRRLHRPRDGPGRLSASTSCRARRASSSIS